MPDDLRDRLRAFIARTAYSQEDVAREAGTSLKTLQNVHNGRPYSAETAGKVGRALDRLIEAEQLGGFEYTIGMVQLRDKVDLLEADLDRIAAKAERLALDMAVIARHLGVDLPAVQDGPDHPR